ncbi:MAG: hypothetical protein EXS14_04715 [Planctomycetes bacterium]|nr:hypothetical protein [Planctomycetota bacterium]
MTLRCPLIFALSLLPLVAQVPTDDAREAHKRWFVREQERPDIVVGTFEVVRFPILRQAPLRLNHDPKEQKRILNPDFWCNRCAREKRIPDQVRRADNRLMDLDAPQVLEALQAQQRGRSWTYIEDAQFKLWIDVPGINLKMEPSRFLKEELAELGDVFPEVTEKTVQIDDHKRAHLVLLRLNRLMRDLCWMLGKDSAGVKRAHPELGPYLGMNGKQEVYVFDRALAYDNFAGKFIGRTAPGGQCWHLFKSRAMVALIDASNHGDARLTNAIHHRVAHNLLDAYRMYSFKLPAWFQMGLAAFIERREDPNWNCFCYSEGTIPKLLYESNWMPKVKRMLTLGDVDPFVAVAPIQEYGDLKPEYHMVSWSWFCFMLRLGPEKLPVFIEALKSKTEQETLHQVQVRAFRTAYGLSMLEFDEAWRVWVKALYPDV